jgi:hypothetical protein
MALSHSRAVEQSERIDVELELHPLEKRVKIRVESHDERLGWYTAGSLSLGLHQLPLLEQAIEQLRAAQAAEDGDKIIPFPV